MSTNLTDAHMTEFIGSDQVANVGQGDRIANKKLEKFATDNFLKKTQEHGVWKLIEKIISLKSKDAREDLLWGLQKGRFSDYSGLVMNLVQMVKDILDENSKLDTPDITILKEISLNAKLGEFDHWNVY